MSRRVSKTSNRTRLDANKALAGLPRERIALSERDSPSVIDLLENPPEPNARLIRAAELLRKRAPGP
jgi:uncharacterized protein (DUF1778 family)